MVGTASITAFALAIGLWLFFHKNAPKFTTLLFLIAGFGIGGLLGNWLTGLVNMATDTAGNQTSLWLGIGASTLISIVALIAALEIVIKGLWKKKAKPKRWHPWLALALPTIIAISGFPILNEVFGAFNAAVNNVGGSLTATFGG